MDNDNIKHSRLSDSSSDQVLLEYFNYKSKCIDPHRRKVFYSKELKSKIEQKYYQNKYINGSTSCVDDLIRCFALKFENGEDINGHLSRKVNKADNNDVLLNSWNIKHLHLNPQKANNDIQMKGNRSNWLLFFIVDDANVFFLDVIEHPKGCGFSSFNFLKIASSNDWMNKLGFYQIDGATHINIEITDDTKIYELLHKSHVNVNFTIDGKIYMAMGISLQGDNVGNVLICNKLNSKLHGIFQRGYSFIKYMPRNEKTLDGYISLEDNSNKEHLFEICFDKNNIIVFDRETKCKI